MLLIINVTLIKLPTSALANNGISWNGEMAWPLLSPDNKMVTVKNMEKCASDKYGQICFNLLEPIFFKYLYLGVANGPGSHSLVSFFSSNFIGISQPLFFFTSVEDLFACLCF